MSVFVCVLSSQHVTQPQPNIWTYCEGTHHGMDIGRWTNILLVFEYVCRANQQSMQGN